MRKNLLIITFIGVFISACTNDKHEITPEVGYPKEIGSIISYKCATAGCHNTQSAGSS